MIMPYFFAVGVRKLSAFMGVFFAAMLLAACSQSPEIATKGAQSKVLVGPTPEHVFLAFLAHRTQQKGCLSGSMEEPFGLDGTTAYVTYELKFNNGETEEGTLTLIQESGQWKTQVE